MGYSVRAQGQNPAGRVSILSALSAGFKLCLQRPVSVLTWGALIECGFLILAALEGRPADPFRAPTASVTIRAASKANNAGPAFDVGSLLPAMLALALLTVVLCAGYRAILRPAERSFAYLRIGKVEAASTLYTIGWLFLPFAAPLLGGWLGVAGTSAGIKLPSTTGNVVVWLSLLVAFGGLCVGPLISLWALFRLSLFGPMAVDLGRISLRGAWRASRGHFWALLGMGIAVWVIVLIWSGLASLLLDHSGLNRKTAFTPQFLTVFVIDAIIAGAGTAILAAPWAQAYRNLTGPDVASTF